MLEVFKLTYGVTMKTSKKLNMNYIHYKDSILMSIIDRDMSVEPFSNLTQDVMYELSDFVNDIQKFNFSDYAEI